MGASAKTFARLIDLKQAGLIGVGTRMVELGSQNISHTSGEDLRTFISEFRDEPSAANSAELERIAAGGTMASLMKLCGVTYLALDIFEAEDTMLFDLNTDRVPEHLRGQFDLVTNFGTSEHVIDQYRVFETVHELVKPRGVIYHDVPMGGYFYHGYFSYTPLFFNHMALANGYEVVFKHFSKVPIAAPLTQDTTDELIQNGWPDPGYHDVGIEYIFRKTTDGTFRIPVDAGTSVALNRAFVEGKRSDTLILRAPAADQPAADQPATDQPATDQPGTDQPGTDQEASVTLAAKRAAVDRGIESVLGRFTDPSLDYREILRLYEAHGEAYEGIPFPPLLEKKGLDLALASDPQREDLRARLRQVEKLLEERWPLLRFGYDAAAVDERAIAMDGIEGELLSIPCRKIRFDHAVATFHRYLAAGRPERYPPVLELDALRYAAGRYAAGDCSLSQSSEFAAGKIPNGITDLPSSTRRNRNVNDIAGCLTLFDNFEPFSGYVLKGFLVDFLGCLTDGTFRTMWGVDPGQEGGRHITTQCPDGTWGEGLCEVVDWLESAYDARDTYTMITLGACYGAQAVGAFRALQRLNPMPAKLVAVEADPECFAWLQQHFRNNGLDPTRHWLLQCALSDSNKPVLFPVGSPGSGANDCYFTNDRSRKLQYARELMEDPNLIDRISNLIVDGDTGIDMNLAAGWDFPARIKFVSAVTLADVLAPFDRVDLLESDIQSSERVVFPPAMDLIKAKVKRVHIGTHGSQIHDELVQAFAARRFEIVFNYEPHTHHETPWGSFDINDGVISARNLDL